MNNKSNETSDVLDFEHPTPVPTTPIKPVPLKAKGPSITPSKRARGKEVKLVKLSHDLPLVPLYTNARRALFVDFVSGIVIPVNFSDLSRRSNHLSRRRYHGEAAPLRFDIDLNLLELSTNRAMEEKGFTAHTDVLGEILQLKTAVLIVNGNVSVFDLSLNNRIVFQKDTEDPDRLVLDTILTINLGADEKLNGQLRIHGYAHRVSGAFRLNCDALDNKTMKGVGFVLAGYRGPKIEPVKEVDKDIAIKELSQDLARIESGMNIVGQTVEQNTEAENGFFRDLASQE